MNDKLLLWLIDEFKEASDDASFTGKDGRKVEAYKISLEREDWLKFDDDALKDFGFHRKEYKNQYQIVYYGKIENVGKKKQPYSKSGGGVKEFKQDRTMVLVRSSMEFATQLASSKISKGLDVNDSYLLSTMETFIAFGVKKINEIGDI